MATTSRPPTNNIMSPENIPLMMRRRTHHNTTTRLLTLPAEVRNKIYIYAIGGHEIHINIWLASYTNYTKLERTFALVRTCRQIYTEAHKYLYSENTFNFPYYTFYLDVWAGRSSLDCGQLGAIQNIVLEEWRLFFFDGQRWIVPWMAYIKTFPNLEKVVMRGKDLGMAMEHEVKARGGACWTEYVGMREGERLKVVIENA